MSTKRRKSSRDVAIKDILSPSTRKDYQTIAHVNPDSVNHDYFTHHLPLADIIVDTDYEGTSASIRSAVKNGKLCKDKIRGDNIKSSLANSDFILTITEMSINSSGEVETKIVGFATVKIIYDTKRKASLSSKPKIAMFIDVFCGHIYYKKVGTRMMTELRDIAKSLEIKTIHLDSITESLGFYANIGFECDPTCKMRWKI